MSELRVRLLPGYQLAESEVLTREILNLIARPAVTLEGLVGTETLGAGAVAEVNLAANAVSAAKLKADVIESGGGLALDGTSNALEIADDGVTPAKTLYGDVAVTSAAGAADIDWSLGSTFHIELTENTAFTFSNAKLGQGIVIAIKQPDPTGNYTVDFSGVTGLVWKAGMSTVQTVTGGKVDLWGFIYVNSVYYGIVSHNF